MVEALSLSDAAYKSGVLASICSMEMIPNTLPRLEVNFTEAVWDHLDKKTEQKASNIQRRASNVLQDAWRTIPNDYLKRFQAC